MQFDVAIIGGGPSGLAAAIESAESGVNVLILERDSHLGGILNQCIHNGFGLHTFKEELTGPEYADRFIKKVFTYRNITVKFGTMVLEISKDRKIIAVNPNDGLMEIDAKAIILAMGCRERTRGAINISGSRPSGVLTAGAAQKLVNLEGQKVGNKVVILGSGDIGLIMARRMTYEGAKVLMVCEVMPYSTGLSRNIQQCLVDYDIPLKLSTTVIEIIGKDRVEAVVIAKVDENKKPIMDTCERVECDTVLLSVGLIPENDLVTFIPISPNTNGAIVDQYRMTLIDGIFAAGNALHVHDLVDNVSDESSIAGLYAAKFAKGEFVKNDGIKTISGKNVGYVLPQIIRKSDEKIKLYFRTKSVIKNPIITVTCEGKEILTKKKLIVVPGEMETVLIDSNVCTNDITIDIN